MRSLPVGSGLLVGILCAGCALATHAGTVGPDELNVGSVRYLDDTNAVLRAFAPPISRQPNPRVVAGGFDDTWSYSGLRVRCYDGWQCVQIEVSDSQNSVGRGLRVGALLAGVLAVYGQPTYRRTTGDTTYLSYPFKGRARAYVGMLVKTTADTVRVLEVGQLTFVFM